MKIAGVKIKVEKTTYRAFFILVLIPFFVIGGYTAIFYPAEVGVGTFLNALLVGVGFAVYHAIAQLVHQLGHALAARATGYPMTGIRYDYIFTYSEYPPNEPSLPARVHIQRSLGGVGGATLVLAMGILLWLQVDVTTSGFMRWLFNFLLFDSVLLFIASAILSDGLLFILNKDWKTPQPDA